MAGKSSQLQAGPQADAALSPEQRKYKTLAAKIEKAKLELLAWQEQEALFEQGASLRMTPLMAELAACQYRFVIKLASLVAGPGRTAIERKTMRRALCEQAAQLVDSEFIGEEQAAELKALHDLHADVQLDQVNAEVVANMKAMFEAASGVDLGDEEFDSHEALLDRVQQKLQAQAQDASADDADDADAADFRTSNQRKPHKPSVAQQRAEHEAKEASMSVREVFRKLASALHPDRAIDDADRVQRTLMMQRVNQAYAKQDLLGLFALQLEIEQIDPAHLAQASSERMRHYNRVLSAQLQELLDELEWREEEFCMAFGIEPWLRVKPNKLPALLNEQVKELKFVLMQAQSDLQQLDVPANVKRLLKELRKLQERNDIEDFLLPF
jgi:hypothetical protein